MFWCQNLRPVGVNFSVPHAHFVHAVHQFRDEIKVKTSAAKGGDLTLRRQNHLRILDCVIEVVLVHCRSRKVTGRKRISICGADAVVSWEASRFSLQKWKIDILSRISDRGGSPERPTGD